MSASVLVCGCTFACPYCGEPEHAVVHGPRVSVESLLDELSAQPQLEGVVLTGGEPTSAESCEALVRALADQRIPVRLDTNGATPELLEALLGEHLLEFVALDVKTTPERYDLLVRRPGAWSRVERSIAALVGSGVEHEFRTTCYPFGVTSGDLPSIAARLKGGQRYVLQQFAARRTLDPAASTATPWPAEELRRAAMRCSVHIPTVVRGV